MSVKIALHCLPTDVKKVVFKSYLPVLDNASALVFTCSFS